MSEAMKKAVAARKSRAKPKPQPTLEQAIAGKSGTSAPSAAKTTSATYATPTTNPAENAPSAPRAPLATETTIHSFEQTDKPEHSERWGNILAEANRLHPNPYVAAMMWVESRCVAAGLHPMDEVWRWHFENFYGSGKMVDAGRFGLRAAKSDSCMRVSAAEALMIQRTLEPRLVGVCPIISAAVPEASDRFDTARQVLAACGLSDLTGVRNADDPYGFSCAGGGQSARTITTYDSQGHHIEFRIYHCAIVGAIGYTGIAGFFDELDKWGRDGLANPAQRVVDLAMIRYTTQPAARVHAMSASYFPESYHYRMIKEGDTPLQRVARMGPIGAARDQEARWRLHRLLSSGELHKGDPDLALLEGPSDPMSVDIPCWVTNPTVAPIERCYEMNKGKIRQMLALNGGRADYNATTSSGGDFSGLLEANLRLQSVPTGTQTLDGFRRASGEPTVGRCYDGPSWDPRSFTHGRGRGVL
jgi:hypothetical protein